jgi:hypothetical protein
MQDPPLQQRFLGFLDQQVRKQGYPKVIAAPVTALATIGTALAVLGSNWLLFGTVVGGGTCIAAILLLLVEHQHSLRFSAQVSELTEQLSLTKAKLEQRKKETEAAIDEQGAEIQRLQVLIANVRWITERMTVCCYTTSNGASSIVNANRVCQVSQFNDLESVVLDYAFELLGNDSARRIVIYYGDETRLEPVHKTGWPRTNPRVLVAAQPTAPLEVNATFLLDALRNQPEIYVPDVTCPSEEHQRYVGIVPDHHDYRTLACFRLASMRSTLADSTERATLLGALLVQDARPDALANIHEREFFAVLANVLATGFLAVGLKLIKTGRDQW